MPHPTEGALRRLLDEPAAVVDADRRHAADCPHCAAALVEAREDAALVGAALTAPAVDDVDLAAAWRRLSATSATGTSRVVPLAPRTARLRAALRRPAVAALAAGVVLAGAGTAAAGGWLQIFQTERVAAVPFRTSDLLAVPDLSAYGELTLSGDPDLHEVPDAAAAAAETGLDVPEVAALPRGISGEPTYQVGRQVTATFTFSAERAAQAASRGGQALPPPPRGLDGSAVRLVAGPGVAQVWSSDAGAPGLVVGRAVAPRAFSSGGPPFETVRDYLLSLPGLPPRIAAQLRTFAADGSTLPLPVPAEEVETSSAQVDGVPATLLTTRNGVLAAVVWVEDGLVTVVAGSLDDDEVLDVARDLR